MDISQYSGSLRRENIISIVGRSLSAIDGRLIDHGERVAYIAGRIADVGELPSIDKKQLLVLAMLHDIGAYKTDEIDNMVVFETGDVEDHAVYGYAFLKNTTVIGDNAEAILYHHTDFCELPDPEKPTQLMASLIFLADRIDILMMSECGDIAGVVDPMAGTVFSPTLTELYHEAEKRFDISGHIMDGSFKDIVKNEIASLEVPDSEALGFLEMLVYSIDFRSPYTVTHTANTVAISLALAELMGLDASDRANVAEGAFLHDIGKITIPFSILESTGKLSPEDLATMRTHVVKSEDILKGMVPDAVYRIATRHHEKLNGSGYPGGLKSDELTLPEKIVAVSDIMSALVGRRSYKPPFPKEKTCAILSKMRDDGELSREVCNAAIQNYDAIFEQVNASDDPTIELYNRIRSDFEETRKEFSNIGKRM